MRSISSMIPWAVLTASTLCVPACGGDQQQTTPAEMEGTTGDETYGEPGYQEGEAEGMDEEQPDFDGRDGAMGMADMCPMALHDVELRVEEIDGGVAYEFSGDPEQRQALQQRVQHLGQHYQQQATEPAQMGVERVPGSAEHPFVGISALRARMTPTRDGARLELTTDEMAEVEILRQRAEQHGQRLQDMNGCPSMNHQQMHGDDAMRGQRQEPGMAPGQQQQPGMPPGPAAPPRQPGADPAELPGMEQDVPPGRRPAVPRPGTEPGAQPGASQP